jgi:DNA polymerase-1
MYGSTAAGVAYGLGIETQEAQELIDLYFRLFPKLKDYIDFTHSMAVSNKAIITPFGRRKMQYGLLECFAKTAVWNAAKRNAQNCMIQSSTSDVGLFAFMNVNERIKALGGKTLCTVYDSIELEIPIPRLEEAVEIVYSCMNDLPVQTFDWITLPIGVEVELGKNWGEVTPVHRGTQQQKLELLVA